MEALTVPDTLDSLKAIANYVLTAAAAAGLDKKASYKLRQAVDEIASNIIIYGYQEAGRSGVLDLQAELNEQALTIWIEDTAIPYDPFQTPCPNFEIPMDKRPLGGVGVYLAIHNVDKFIYERVGDRNRNIFVLWLNERITMEKLTVAGTLDSLAPIKEYVRAAAAAAGLNDKGSYRLVLAVDEIATNIIEYSYVDYSGELHLQAEFDEQALTITMDDTGAPFDPTEQLLPDVNQPMNGGKIGGWGVYLTLHSVDKFIYERVEDRNRNIFIMWLNERNCSATKQ